MAPAVTVVRLDADQVILLRHALRAAAKNPKEVARGELRKLLVLAEDATAVVFRTAARPPRHAHGDDRWGLR